MTILGMIFGSISNLLLRLGNLTSSSDIVLDEVFWIGIVGGMIGGIWGFISGFFMALVTVIFFREIRNVNLFRIVMGLITVIMWIITYGLLLKGWSSPYSAMVVMVAIILAGVIPIIASQLVANS